ncbi:hypothetical protein MNO14_10645 [Luteimonas sp. S4-F44]|uniref:DUF6624 domain-containing protein n=1 Tax=Luteimonas sp. S4-F44 TaxID=2925842 RepID=UPI001F53483C|nr:DUF6624 domain-containing protein [Luteimonas sp. S4-F44]UNK41430.1 hypothetical protein MNO14_10645 [Luteimonas sp. S4-F44]
MGRATRRALSALLLLAGGSAAWAGTPTPVLLDRLPADSAVDLTRLDWIRPRFSSDPTERAHWHALLDWAKATRRARTSALRETLRTRGVDAAALPEACYGDRRCGLIMDAEATAAAFDDWPAFEAAAKDAWPYVLGLRRAVEIVSQVQPPSTDREEAHAVAADLQRRATNDQILRYALDGVPGRDAGPDDPLYATYAFALGDDVRRLDADNAAFAAQLMTRHDGWPALTALPEQAQAQLWLLVQHADQRPDLQYQALLAMQRRHADGAVPARYGFLYDRVMLKLDGRQRYGTQVTCIESRRAPQPLEDEARVDALRAELKMPPLSEYLAQFPDCATAP